jgi:methyl-accepting chemotaxis protein
MIASAVQQQSTPSRRSPADTNELAGNMANVASAIDEMNDSATSVLEASGALAAQAGTLQQAIDAFLR